LPRPRNCRIVRSEPVCAYFKPAGIPVSRLDETVLTMDEFEAVRLADFEGYYQAGAAEFMHVSRQTFGRILESAHRKIGEALVYGKGLKIEGGDYKMTGMREFKCYDCQHTWKRAFGGGRPPACPACGSGNFHRIDAAAGLGPGKGGGGGAGIGSSQKRGRGKRCGVRLEEKLREKAAGTDEK